MILRRNKKRFKIIPRTITVTQKQ